MLSAKYRAILLRMAAVCVGLMAVAVPSGWTRALAAATEIVADWRMDEPSGATVMIDASGNGLHGVIGTAVLTGIAYDGAIGYRWPHTSPNAPPPQPERLIQVDDDRLNPGAAGFAVTVRFRTTRSFGNIIQKGQSGNAGGYFKWQIPNGRLSCLFRGVVDGELISKAVNSGDLLLNDGAWHTVRCERTATGVTMTVDGTVTRRAVGWSGVIRNSAPLVIGGKLNCDQIETNCDYFVGDIDYVRIESSEVQSTDGTPPTTPGKPAGEVVGPTSVRLSWPGSVDSVSTVLTYRIYRDGELVGSVVTSEQVPVFIDTGAEPGSAPVYAVDAVDSAGNVSARSDPSEPIALPALPPPIFADDFSAGLGAWDTVTRVTVDDSTGGLSPPSAAASVEGLSAFATRSLGSSYPGLCVAVSVRETVFGGNVLIRLRTASGGPIARLGLDGAGYLRIRSDVSGEVSPRAGLLGAGWHRLELCGEVGPASAWTLRRDGAALLTGWVADTGGAGIGRVQIGDTAAKTWSANFDDVVVREGS